MDVQSTIVIPAYGRDYATAAEVLKDWNDGKDFIISDMSNQWNGKYCSIRDGLDVKIRYRKLQDFLFVRVKSTAGCDHDYQDAYDNRVFQCTFCGELE
jgi:hypothetical protein